MSLIDLRVGTKVISHPYVWQRAIRRRQFRGSPDWDGQIRGRQVEIWSRDYHRTQPAGASLNSQREIRVGDQADSGSRHQ
jgi:hypothetical protein